MTHETQIAEMTAKLAACEALLAKFANALESLHMDDNDDLLYGRAYPAGDLSLEHVEMDAPIQIGITLFDLAECAKLLGRDITWFTEGMKAWYRA